MNNEKFHPLKRAALLAAIILIGAGGAVTGLLYIDATEIEFLKSNETAVKILLTVLIAASTSAVAALAAGSRERLMKLLFFVEAFFCAALALLYLIKITGLWEKVGSVEKLREFISERGVYAVPIFILVQFLQVAVLPIPGAVTIGAGTALFGAFLGGVYSLIGILSASFFAFFVGRKFGAKAVGAIAGKKNLEKGLALVKGKDKVILTFMFLFPFFPDDILCFVSGLSTMSAGYYAVMITLTRIISVFLASYSLGGEIIPYDNPYGIAAWVAIFALTAALCAFVYKKGDKIEAWFSEKFNRGKRNGKDDTSRRSQ